jgi:hypothetical protein
LFSSLTLLLPCKSLILNAFINCLSSGVDKSGIGRDDWTKGGVHCP